MMGLKVRLGGTAVIFSKGFFVGVLLGFSVATVLDLSIVLAVEEDLSTVLIVEEGRSTVLKVEEGRSTVLIVEEGLSTILEGGEGTSIDFSGMLDMVGRSVVEILRCTFFLITFRGGGFGDVTGKRYWYSSS